MESSHMTQQVFADFIGLAPATLSGIFNDRTRPTLNVVEAIKKKIPNISTDWLMFGTGAMYVQENAATDTTVQEGNSTSIPTSSVQFGGGSSHEPMLDFSQTVSPTPQNHAPVVPNFNGVRGTHPEISREEIKFIDKPQRRVTEIRVYYDDQTWESFVPAKK